MVGVSCEVLVIKSVMEVSIDMMREVAVNSVVFTTVSKFDVTLVYGMGGVGCMLLGVKSTMEVVADTNEGIVVNTVVSTAVSKFGSVILELISWTDCMLFEFRSVLKVVYDATGDMVNSVAFKIVSKSELPRTWSITLVSKTDCE